MNQTLKEHEHLIDEHDVRLDNIQNDVTDIKVRLGIKDITNGNVIQYQKDLVKAQEDERAERKEQDRLLLEQIAKIDERLWYLAVGIGVSVLLEIAVFIIQSHL
jgi:uncharacterized metal-binding protein